jgi:hypothetical protein
LLLATILRYPGYGKLFLQAAKEIEFMQGSSEGKL